MCMRMRSFFAVLVRLIRLVQHFLLHCIDLSVCFFAAVNISAAAVHVCAVAAHPNNEYVVILRTGSEVMK